MICLAYSVNSQTHCFRIYKSCCPTYESASLRMFRLGRTDTIRSTSIDSAKFVKAMDDPAKHVWSPLLDILVESTFAHIGITPFESTLQFPNVWVSKVMFLEIT